jgi:oligopeptidase B
LSLLDRGVVYGIAHVRGGGEMGKRWHDDGKLLRKKNTFTDFIACCEHLIAEGYTSKEKLAVTGRSAGGLLMGAVVNMRPDLFKAVFTAVPFVDVMNTMLDSSVPLTTQEYLEWGDPNDKAAYDYMKSYSPYDRVERKAYPTMLVRTSLNDSQVMYWEPAKWVAKLRAHKTDDRVLLLKTRMDPGGHGGASGRYDRLRDVAFEYAFVLWNLGIEE